MSEHAAHTVLPVRAYLGVWATLLFFTAVTVGVSFYDFGTFNMVVAMGVASFKALLVALIFMGLLVERKFYALVFLGSLVFVGLFFVFTFADLMARGDIDSLEKGTVSMKDPFGKAKKPAPAASAAPASTGAAAPGAPASPAMGATPSPANAASPSSPAPAGAAPANAAPASAAPAHPAP